MSINLTQELKNEANYKEIILLIDSAINEIYYSDIHNQIIDKNYVFGVIWMIIVLLVLWVIIKVMKLLINKCKANSKEKTE